MYSIHIRFENSFRLKYYTMDGYTDTLAMHIDKW